MLDDKVNKSLVLVVDDIESNLDFIYDVISDKDIDVIGATSGFDCLKYAGEKKPDLILLDISMPEMDGYEVCEKLKANPETSEIPVIFLTARVQKEDIVKGFEVGAVDYILKPFNFNELISRVKTHLDLKHKTEQLKDMNIILEEKVKERTQQLIEANENLQDTNAKLEEALDELSLLDKAKNEFINHINHELRTPINGILGYTSLLTGFDETSEEYEYVKAIDSLTRRLIKLSELSLMFTEIQVNKFEYSLDKINVYESVTKVLNNLDTDGKKISIKIKNINENTFVKANDKLLSTCISIIIDNAIKYSPEDGKITIEGEEKKQSFLISIIDSGPGFSDKAKQQLYDLFGADNLDYKSHGFGIGLATAKSIIDVLGGKMKILNNKRKGAKVILTIPHY